MKEQEKQMKFTMKAAVVLLMIVLPAAGSATTLVKLNETDMIHSADRVAVGTIMDSWTEWDGDSGMMYTYAVLSVEENLLRDEPADGQVVIRALGGKADGMRVTVPSSPDLSRIGERLVVFMWDDPELYQSNLIGWEQGCKTVDDDGMVRGTGLNLDDYLDKLRPIIKKMKIEESRNSFSTGEETR